MRNLETEFIPHNTISIHSIVNNICSTNEGSPHIHILKFPLVKVCCPIENLIHIECETIGQDYFDSNNDWSNINLGYTNAIYEQRNDSPYQVLYNA